MIKKTLVAVALAGISVAACSSSSTSTTASSTAGSASAAGSGSGATSSGPALTGSITVLAAASLTGSFTTLKTQFIAAHPGVSITFSFGASSKLATTITAGGPGDVFASASTKNMDQVVTAGDATGPANFAKNVMEIAVPPSNPANITTLADLARSGVKVVLCEDAVPCGATAIKVFANAKITVTAVSKEADVKTTLAKVTSGEADAGVVYVTDVLAAGSTVKGIPIDPSVNASTEYPIATLKGAKNAALASAFVAYVESDAGQAVLAQAGFEKP